VVGARHEVWWWSAPACGVFLVVAVAAFRKQGGDEWRGAVERCGRLRVVGGTTVSANRASKRALRSVGVGRLGKPLRTSRFDAGRVPAMPPIASTSIRWPPAPAGHRCRVLAELGAFPVQTSAPGCEKSWNTLREGKELRAFVDETTLLWVLKKKLGDRITYLGRMGQRVFRW